MLQQLWTKVWYNFIGSRQHAFCSLWSSSPIYISRRATGPFHASRAHSGWQSFLYRPLCSWAWLSVVPKRVLHDSIGLSLTTRQMHGMLQGFLMPTVTASGGSSTEALLLCLPPTRTRLDTAWSLRRIPLGSTPDRIAHDTVNNIYAVLTTQEVWTSNLVSLSAVQAMHIER